MRIQIISIGGELLIGHTVNTNFAFIAQVLAEHGFDIEREICIPDNRAIMTATIRDALNTSDLVITIGGLGPTRDDLTREAVAMVTEKPLIFSQTAFDRIAAFLGQRKKRLPEQALKTQAMAPQDSLILHNNNGTAPALWCPVDNKTILILPGPPRELKPIFIKQAMPLIQKQWRPDRFRKTLRVCGIPESIVAERTEKLIKPNENLEVAYCARPGIVDVRLTAPIDNKLALINSMQILKQEFNDVILDQEDDLNDALARKLKTEKLNLAVAESCTGGAIGARLTDVPGASEFFKGGVIAYSNEIKQKILNVDEKILIDHGAVSEQTAAAMVEGVCTNFHTETGIAVTGIAGPTGGTPEKPVGLVFIATQVNAQTKVTQQIFPGNRDNVRLKTVNTAINQLREQIHGLK